MNTHYLNVGCFSLSNMSLRIQEYIHMTYSLDSLDKTLISAAFKSSFTSCRLISLTILQNIFSHAYNFNNFIFWNSSVDLFNRLSDVFCKENEKKIKAILLYNIILHECMFLKDI